jgi:hypothetical protein
MCSSIPVTVAPGSVPFYPIVQSGREVFFGPSPGWPEYLAEHRHEKLARRLFRLGEGVDAAFQPRFDVASVLPRMSLATHLFRR